MNMYTIRFSRYYNNGTREPFTMAVVTDLDGIMWLFRELEECDLDALLANVADHHEVVGESRVYVNDESVTIDYRIEEML
jgi:hypothetical protein